MTNPLHTPPQSHGNKYVRMTHKKYVGMTHSSQRIEWQRLGLVKGVSTLAVANL